MANTTERNKRASDTGERRPERAMRAKDPLCSRDRAMRANERNERDAFLHERTSDAHPRSSAPSEAERPSETSVMHFCTFRAESGHFRAKRATMFMNDVGASTGGCSEVSALALLRAGERGPAPLGSSANCARFRSCCALDLERASDPPHSGKTNPPLELGGSSRAERRSGGY